MENIIELLNEEELIEEKVSVEAGTDFVLDSVKSYLEIKQEFLADSALQEGHIRPSFHKKSRHRKSCFQKN